MIAREVGVNDGSFLPQALRETWPLPSVRRSTPVH
jgi:hypothetical protein